MKRRIRRRRFYAGEVNHVYQRSRDGFNIFYDVIDYLVYFTVFSVSAKKYDVMVMGLCLMVDHIHMLLRTENRITLSEFVRQVTSVFVMEYNSSICRKGPLFTHRFGSAPKIGDKKIRTSIAYHYNNPVEKGLCQMVQDYRWAFLPYRNSSRPYVDRAHAFDGSRKLKKAMSEVYACYTLNRHLKYSQLWRLMRGMQSHEQERLSDYIISLYGPIDYEETIRYYGSYEAMLTALNSNTGAEYDIKEKYSSFPDTYYEHLRNFVRQKMPDMPVRNVIMLPASEKFRLFEQMRGLAPTSMIAKFLHLKTCSK